MQMSVGCTLIDLHTLIRECRIEEAKRVLDKDHSLTRKKDDSGRCVIHLAATAGLLPLVQLSIETEGVHPDIEDDIGWTPLMCASSSGKSDIIRYLLSNPQVEVSHRNNNGQTPLHYAASKDHSEIVCLLLENGADMNGRDKWGATPLHRAASQGRDKIVSLLLQTKGIKVNVKDGEGKTPLYLACDESREECAVSIVLAGGDLDCMDNEGKSCVDVMKDVSMAEKVIHVAKMMRQK